MFNFICKSFPHLNHSFRTTKVHKFYFLQLNLLSVEALKPTLDNAKEDSFTVNYLIKTCGFPPEKAISASNYVNFNKPDKPDAVIALLKNQGFTLTQVFNLIRKYPKVVALNSEKNLLPKIEFFQRYHLPCVLLVVPHILGRSLKKEILPSFDYLRNLIGNDENTTMAIKRCPSILLCVRRLVAPNVHILKQAGVPEARIANFLTLWPANMMHRSARYKEFLDKVKEMGIDPRKSTFVIGVMVMMGLSRLTWKKKMEVYKRWGCSEDEVLAAFKIYPWCMLASVDKIEGIMEFLVNEMGWKSSMLIKTPQVFTLSFKRRIIPRCSVYRVLLSKGLIKEPSSLWSMLKLSEKKFLEYCVKCSKEEAPELLNLYQEKLELGTTKVNSV